MPSVHFEALPNDARLWIFAADRTLSGNEAEGLLRRVDEHIERWTAHGRPVIGGRALMHHQFLMVAADEAASGVSGCSIDSLFQTLQQVEQEMGVGLLDASNVWFRSADDHIAGLSRPAFRARAEAGAVNGDTTVFNNTVRSVGDVRGGRWELPLRDSWHAKAFPAAV